MVDQPAEPHATPGRGPQTVPVRVYEGDGRLMVAAPLPGLEPPDISVTVRGDRVVLHGERRGPRQDERRLHLAEWTTGPSHRELTLPQGVDGGRANATYGNGVLVLALPKAEPGRPGRDTELRLDVLTELRLEGLAATRGAHVGHTGRDRHQTTTAEHLQRQGETARRAGTGTRPGSSPP